MILPATLVKEIVSFFIELFELESLVFPRSLMPKNEETIGKPELVIFSDGSVAAFGAVVYIRWKLRTGKWWSTLVLSKSKIAPKNRITVPRLELNGAVLSKRLDEFVTSTLDTEFANIHHLVDSSTVLGYLHKPDAKLKPFEGVRVSEIQTAGKFLDGRLFNWSWIDGQNNPADWATKPRSVEDLKEGGFWQKGPSFLEEDVMEWPNKLDFRVDKLDGEIQPKGVLTVLFSSEIHDMLSGLLDRVSSTAKLFRILAYHYKWISLVRCKEMPRVSGVLLSKEIYQAKVSWIKFIQQDLYEDLMLSVEHESKKSKVSGKFKRLSPFRSEDMVWRIGSRLREFTPFTEDNKPPALLPYGSRFTLLLMREAHEIRHSGVVDTVAQFRLLGYWTSNAKRLARQVRNSCVTCRHLDHQPIQQIMGNVPKERLVNPIAWGHIELDLFGPMVCKSDVNKRSTKKVWAMLIIDVNSGAIHCDLVLDYSSQEVLKTLRRFASLRGWPLKISSDPGSQLQSASGNMTTWWPQMQKDLAELSTSQGFEWDIRPANSPWRQGKSEVSIKIVKRLLKIAMGESKLTTSDLQTVLFEVANLCNERPVGINRYPQAD